jgi:membrane protease YdiL (CAAX protease family)
MSLPPDRPDFSEPVEGSSSVSQAFQIDPSSPSSLVAPDIDVPWGWRELIIFVVAALFIALLAGFPVYLLFKLVHADTQVLFAPGPSKEKSVFLLCTQAIWAAAVMIFLWASIRRHFGRPFWRTVGWRPLGAEPASPWLSVVGLLSLGCGLAFLVQVAAAKLPKANELPIQQFFQDRESALILMLMSVLLAPMVEETIFRGYIYPVFARSWGVASAIVSTGAVFGLMHAAQLWTGWLQIGLLVLVGVVFTSVRAFTKSVTASWLVHMAYNGFLFIGFLASGGLRNLH